MKLESFAFHADYRWKIRPYKGERRLCIKSWGEKSGRDFPSDSQVRRLREWLGLYLANRSGLREVESLKEIRIRTNAVKRGIESHIASFAEKEEG